MPSLEQKENLQTEEAKQILPTLERRPSLGHETSALSVQSDSTLEFHDAPSPADGTRPEWQSHNRIDEDDEVVIKRPESDPTNKLLSAEEPIVGQEMKTDEKVLEIKMLLDAAAEHAREDTEEQTLDREVQSLPAVPITSLEESNRDDSVNPEVVLEPREPIRTSGISEETIREGEVEDSEPVRPPITEDAVTAEEPIRDSPKESESHESSEHSVVNNKPISELPASFDVCEELADKPEAMETSGEDSLEWVESG